MKIHIVTAFPKSFDSVFSQSIISRASQKKLVKIKVHDLRDQATDKRKTIDDRPYGGGPGMVLMAPPIVKSVEKITATLERKPAIFLLSPQGKLLDQKLAQSLSRRDEIILICGHYEGIDERIKKILKAKELSVGNYILSGGEIAAMVVVDVLVRLLPGSLGQKQSLESETFNAGLTDFDFPQYTRPAVFKAQKVPKVLLSGNHGRIDQWRKEKSLEKTKKRS